MPRTIAVATDGSIVSHNAYVHALALAILHSCKLDILHVSSSANHESAAFPAVRSTLSLWGMLEPTARAEDIALQTGVQVRKVSITDPEPASGIGRFLISHRPDLLVMSTHGRVGVERWVTGSVSAEIARSTHLPTLLIGPQAQGFVDADTGTVQIQNILVPVALEPPPHKALSLLLDIIGPLNPTIDCIHVGEAADDIMTSNGRVFEVRQLSGPVVDVIIREARDKDAKCIAMVTAGTQGFLDALMGSTTEQIVHHAPCPVLALPA